VIFTFQLSSISLVAFWLYAHRCNLLFCPDIQLHRSHFTIKSVLTPLLLNKYARWLWFDV